MQLPSARDGDRWGNQMLDVNLKQYDHWAVISRYPRLARYFMSRPGLPTSGMQALGFGLGVGFREIYLSGVDLYESKEARYGYTISQQVAAGLLEKDLRPGYEDAHSIDNDLAFLQASPRRVPRRQRLQPERVGQPGPVRPAGPGDHRPADHVAGDDAEPG